MLILDFSLRSLILNCSLRTLPYSTEFRVLKTERRNFVSNAIYSLSLTEGILV